MENVFSQYTVIDFTRGDFGSVCSEYLALYGFNVIRIESLDIRDSENPYLYVFKNLNKKITTIDFSTEKGHLQMWQLLEKADAFVENIPNDEIVNLGFDYTAVKARNPKILYTSIRPYTTGHPYQNYPSNSSTISASGGASYLCGYAGGEPVEPGMNLPDIISSAFSALGLLAMFYERECSGEGQFMEVSEQAAIIALSRSAYEFYHNNRRNNRVGNAFPTMPDMVPMDMFKARDGYVIIGCMDPKAFEVLCSTMGREDLLLDSRYADFRTRSRYKYELNAEIAKWTSNYGKEEIMHLLLEKGRIVCSVVSDVDDIINNEDLRSIGVIQPIEYENLGKMYVPTIPCLSSEIKITATPPKRISIEDVKGESEAE